MFFGINQNYGNNFQPSASFGGREMFQPFFPVPRSNFEGITNQLNQIAPLVTPENLYRQQANVINAQARGQRQAVGQDAAKRGLGAGFLSDFALQQSANTQGLLGQAAASSQTQAGQFGLNIAQALLGLGALQSGERAQDIGFQQGLQSFLSGASSF